MSSVLHKKAVDNWVKYTCTRAAAASDDSEWAKSVPHKRFWQPAIIRSAMGQTRERRREKSKYSVQIMGQTLF